MAINTYGSLCSGIEAASFVLEPLNMHPLWLSEIAEFQSRFLATRYPHAPNLGDMNDIPEKITIDVSGLDMNQALYIKDIPANPDVKLLLDPEEIVCHVTHVKEEPVAAPAEGEAAADAAAAPAEEAADAEKK